MLQLRQFAQAILDGETSKVKRYLKKNYSENLTIDNIPILHFSIFYGRTEIALLFLQHSADINAKDKFGNTALHIAAMKNDSLFVEHLLAKGANRLEENALGKTAGQVAAACGYCDVAHMLHPSSKLSMAQISCFFKFSAPDSKVMANDVGSKNIQSFFHCLH